MTSDPDVDAMKAELEWEIARHLATVGWSVDRLAGNLWVTDPRSATFAFGKRWIKITEVEWSI